MENMVFYIISGITVASSLLALTVRNLFHCALFLAMAMFGISGVFLYLNSDFLASVQVLIYVGAVTVIIIFGISLTRNMMDERSKAMNHQFLFSIIVAVVLTGIIIAAIQESPFLGSEHPASLALSNTANDLTQTSVNGISSGRLFQNGVSYLGGALLKPENGFAFAFEFVSILLLSALVGAIVIARKDPS
jgi:NADH:ubiquinone oxidoreductase subunit 6 (subunit J)